MDLFRKETVVVAPKEYTLAEALTKINEKAETAESCGYDVEQLHCHGCIKSCLLAKAKCDFGQRVRTALERANGNGSK